MTFEQAFLKIKEKFDNADASNTSDFAIQVTFTDEDCGGTFYAEVKDGKLAVEPYDYYDNDVVLDITKSALLSVLGGRMSLDKAIDNGDASAKGDVSKIADWKNTIKKASAKPAAAKKAPAKKPAAKTAAAKTTAKAETIKEVPAKTTKTETKTPVAKTAAAKTTTKTVSKKK
ncbi:MAG: SCP2 sterol-binding domain-containing protein [Oscillospiraceae bacterium]|nr:SCP2 sterol-binding domain-containing protein [Oscillospiraceae bacterium]